MDGDTLDDFIAGRWINHHGGSPIIDKLTIGETVSIVVQCEGKRGLITPDDIHGPITSSYQGFFWRWESRRTGWFGKKKERVCDDDRFAPITRYRAVFETAEAQKSARSEIEKLRRIADRPMIGVEGPEFKVKRKKGKRRA